MLLRKPEEMVMAARNAERSEARFYYFVLFPLCLVASLIGRVLRLVGLGGARLAQTQGCSVWADARRQVNTIVPFIMMR